MLNECWWLSKLSHPVAVFPVLSVSGPWVEYEAFPKTPFPVEESLVPPPDSEVTSTPPPLDDVYVAFPAGLEVSVVPPPDSEVWVDSPPLDEVTVDAPPDVVVLEYARNRSSSIFTFTELTILAVLGIQIGCV